MDAKKKIEIYAVTEFFKSRGIEVQIKDLDLNPDEPADIVYKKTGQGFQVTTAHGEKTGRTARYQGVTGVLPTTLDQQLKEYIFEPVQRKIDKYRGGEAVKGLILLIYDMVTAVLNLENNLKPVLSTYQNFLESAGFKEIHLVFFFDEPTIKIYPHKK